MGDLKDVNLRIPELEGENKELKDKVAKLTENTATIGSDIILLQEDNKKALDSNALLPKEKEENSVPLEKQINDLNSDLLMKEKEHINLMEKVASLNEEIVETPTPKKHDDMVLIERTAAISNGEPNLKNKTLDILKEYTQSLN